MASIVTEAWVAVSSACTSSMPSAKAMAAAAHGQLVPPHLHKSKSKFSSSGSSSSSKRQYFLLAYCRADGPNNNDERTSCDSSAQLQHVHAKAIPVGRRDLLAALAFSLPLADHAARAAVLEADDDVELLERVKQDRKKRLQRQGIISSSAKETGYLQELIYKLSRVGQAIDKNDLSAASSVLGPNTDADWVKNVNTAFVKLSSSPEEKNEVDTFNSSLASLYTSVGNRDVESSKSAFVWMATALEKWIGLAGLGGQLKGL